MVDWENVQFGRMGDDIHALKILTNGNLKDIELNRDDIA